MQRLGRAVREALAPSSRVVLLGLLATGCGGSSGGGAQLAVSVLFPPPLGLTDAPEIVVRGTALDPDGVAQVQVNGVLATTSNGFASWQALVPLALGDNVLQTTAQDTGGETATHPPLQLRREGRVFGSTGDARWDAAASRILLVDFSQAALLAYDEATATSTVLSSDVVGTGPPFLTPTELAVDSAAGTSYVLDVNLQRILAVDHATGNRATLSDAMTGTGPALQSVTSLVLDLAASRLLALGFAPQALLSVDLATGNRTIVSDASTGTGPALDGPRDMAVDFTAATAFVVDGGLSIKGVLAVDLTTGNRTLLSNATTGTGTDFVTPSAIALDASNGRLLVSDLSVDRVMAVDLSTGDRTVFSEDPTGTGPPAAGLISLDLDAPNARALGLSRAASSAPGRVAVMALDLASGDRTDAWRPQVGSGPEFTDPTGVAIDGAARIGYVTDFLMPLLTPGALGVVDLETGSRSTLAGSGPTLLFPRSVALDLPQGRALVLANAPGGQGVGTIDLAAGSRAILSNPTVGSGPPFVNPRTIALDADSNRALVTDDDASTLALFAVDLTTGDRAIASDASTGTGPVWIRVAGLAVDAALDRAYVGALMASGGAVVEVDLATGDRVVASGVGVGSGPSFFLPHAVVLDQANARILVLRQAALISADLVSGDRTLISGSGAGAGPAILQSTGFLSMAVLGEVAVVTETTVGALAAIDLVTGHRVIVAK